MKVIVVVNKIDRPDARCDEVVDEMLELLMELDATDEQLDSPIVFASGRDGTATTGPDAAGHRPAPSVRHAFWSTFPRPRAIRNGSLAAADFHHRLQRLCGPHRRGPHRARHASRPGSMAVRCDYDSDVVSRADTSVRPVTQFDGLKRVPS